MKKNLNRDEILAVAAAILLLFTPLIDAMITFTIGAIVIVLVLISHFHRHKSNKSTSNNGDSGIK